MVSSGVEPLPRSSSEGGLAENVPGGSVASEEEVAYRLNQVVWARSESEEVWYPGVIVDEAFYRSHAEEDEEKESGSEKEDSEARERIFWLGYSSVSQVRRSLVRDFCVGFGECYKRATGENRTMESVKVAVQLAAVRAQEVLEDPASDWLQWGLSNLHKFEELILSDTFYQSLGRNNANAATNTGPSSEESSGGGGSFRLGSIVWVEEAEKKAWPAILVLPKPDVDKADVVVVAGPQLRRKSSVPTAELRPFCEHLSSELEASMDGEDEDRLASMRRVVAVVSNQSEGELGTDWIAWARQNILRYKDFCLSQDDVRDILKNTSRTNSRKARGVKESNLAAEAKRARKETAEAAASAEQPEEMTEFFMGVADEKLEQPKVKRVSYGKTKGRAARTEFSEEERTRLILPFSKGWGRILAKRREPTKKFGDIYYEPPRGKRLRSMKEVDEYLKSFPQHAEGLSVENFCFTDIPLHHEKERITDPKS